MFFEWSDFFLLIGIIQAFFVVITILFSKYFKSQANVFLGFSMLVGILRNMQYWALKYDWYAEHPK